MRAFVDAAATAAAILASAVVGLWMLAWVTILPSLGLFYCFGMLR